MRVRSVHHGYCSLTLPTDSHAAAMSLGSSRVYVRASSARYVMVTVAPSSSTEMTSNSRRKAKIPVCRCWPLVGTGAAGFTRR